MPRFALFARRGAIGEISGCGGVVAYRVGGMTDAKPTAIRSFLGWLNGDSPSLKVNNRYHSRVGRRTVKRCMGSGDTADYDAANS